MKLRRLITLCLCACSLWTASAQSTPRESVFKTASDDKLTEDLDTGAQTFTISAAGGFTWESGATFGGAAFFRAAVDLEPGTDIQAQDAQLQAIAGLTPAADKLQYWTGSASAALTDFTSVARTFLAYTTVQAQANGLLASGAAQGDIWYFNGTDVTRLSPGTDGYILTTHGAGANPTWAAAASAGMPRSYLAGLKLSNNGTDPTNDIDIAVGACRGDANAHDLVRASAITKRLDAAWAVDDGDATPEGGLDTGSIANTTYHVFLIKRSDTGVVDALFSTSATSPTMPANYDSKRRIGSIIRASGAILAFVQDGDEFTLVSQVLDINDTTLTTSRKTYTLASVPTGIRVRAKLQGYTSHATAGTFVYFGDLSVTDQAPSGGASPLFTAIVHVNGGSGSLNGEYLTNTSAQVCARSSASSTTVRLMTMGWVDRRGRDD